MVGRNGFKMEKPGQDRSRRFRAPATQSRVAVRRVTHQRQVIRNRCRGDAELFDHTGFVGMMLEMAEPAKERVLPPVTEPDIEKLTMLCAKYKIDILGPLPD